MTYTEKCEPDWDIPPYGGGVLNGWTFNTYRSSRDWVFKSCSTSYKHSYDKWDNPNCRGGIKQYSSKKLALKGLAHALEIEFLKKLKEINLQMEMED